MAPEKPHFSPRRVRGLVVAGGLAIAAAVGCSDPTAFGAEDNVLTTFTASAVTGTPPNAPSAINFEGRAITRVDGNLNFDVAFDIDAQNRPVLLPLAVVGTPVTGNRIVGLQKLPGLFDSVSEAPKSGYTFDTAMVVTPGQAVAVQAQQSVCALSLTPYVFAKMVIDSIHVTTRQLFGRATINLNCGFRSLILGTPKY